MRLAIILSLLLLAPALEDWRRVTSNEQAVYSVLDARTDRSRSEVRVWERVEFRETGEGRKYRGEVVRELEGRGVERAADLHHMQARHVYRCEEGQAAFEQFMYYDGRGRVIDHDDTTRLMKWTSPAPGSIGEAMMLDACKRPAEAQ